VSSEAILSVSTFVVAFTQLLKWAVVPDKYGPLLVLGLSMSGVAFWGWDQGEFHRGAFFSYATGFVAVATSAAGVFGFTRATSEAITKTSSPPSGAGGSSTEKMKEGDK
jgi:hypothetical protein